MTIREIVSEALYYARTCRWLWLFGFFVGIASGGSNGGGSGGGGGSQGGVAGAAVVAANGSQLGLPMTAVTAIVIGILLLMAGGFVLRFVGEGALIEGIVKARQGGTMTMREGFRAGWAHWGVLLRIALLYLGATAATIGVLAAACVIAFKALGLLAAILIGIPALAVAVPWLVTLYFVQAFASRIAVLENRHALDAIRHARLFLHGRLVHSLRLMVATLVGTLLFSLVSVVVMIPVVLLLVALIQVLPFLLVVVFGALVLLPAIYVVTAMLGTYRSSVWTIGYVTQVQA